ncbi:MAG: hypothetical protein RI100_03975 [Nitrosarchaeum sp.]|jgi:uncharacterized coiled-coil DUF342 family protein|uniref:hypothetical protein n=1 Tax=Nitrosarchaeum sp. TaxID=2026886 RepID=UPI002DEE815A|nr:hypothetical protein [Nitrosarchaeum sp.]
MVTYNDYLKGILEKIQIAYGTLEKLEDTPGDLDTIKKEISKIKGFFQVFVTKTNNENNQISDFTELKSKFEHYLDTYSFEKEIETMAPLYANDSNRLKNMRLKILESLADKKLMNDIEYLLDKL